MNTPAILLASSSPRRRELLTLAGIPFSISVAGVDETPVEGEAAQQMVERLAHLKADVIAVEHPDAIVIGADTTVAVDGRILGKPIDAADAREMLRDLSGREHLVWGGIAVIHKASGIALVRSFVTHVQMSEMTTDDIESYVATGEPMDKAGAYAIQGIGLQFVESIRGSYSNVVGLDVAALKEMLSKVRSSIGTAHGN